MKKKIFAGALACLCLGGGAMAGEMHVHFFDAGKADAFLLRTENSAVLIDSGKNKMGEEIIAYLGEKGIEALDAMIITHFDKDHVGGADKLIENLPVENVYIPDYESDSKQYRQFEEALTYRGIEARRLHENTSFELDGVKYFIDVSNREDYGPDEENDFSLVTRVLYGEVSFLFAGDAENPRLGELLQEGNLQSDVLKVPHHGRSEDLSAAFFAAVKPKYAVITSDEADLEDEIIVEYLHELGAQVYLTRHGAVDCETDGSKLTFYQD